VVLDDDIGFDADMAMKRLNEWGVGTRPFFWPMHEQPVFRNMGLFKNERCPVAERLARRGLYLPSGLALTDSQIDHVGEAMHRLMSGGAA
jgi:perosamine synthetase